MGPIGGQVGGAGGRGEGDSGALEAVAARALELVENGARLGLGTGRAAAAFIAALGQAVRDGRLSGVSGVATSESSASAARAAGIPVGGLEEGRLLDLTVDGADEVAPNLDLIKGRGGALVHERIVAAAARRQIILVGNDKLVRCLGERHPIPVEVIRLAGPFVLDRLHALGLSPVVRALPGVGMSPTPTPTPALTENGNLTLDCGLVGGPLAGARTARALEAAIRAIPGVVDTGLFLGTAERVLVGFPDGRVEVMTRQPGP
jgi:ribose 5-phosphate isomerase A